MLSILAALAAGAAGYEFPVLDPAITRGEIEAHVRFLASDELDGRATATRGAARAAEYIAQVLGRSGLKPAGDEGTFLQRVPLARTASDGVATCIWKDAQGAEHAWTDIVEFEAPFAPIDAADLPVVTVKSKAQLERRPAERCAVFVDAPASERREWLAGVDAACVAYAIAPGSTKEGQPRPARRRARLARQTADASELPVVRVHGAALERLRAGDVKRIAITSRVVREAATCSNVVARIDPRAGSATASETVVLSAHYDHFAHEIDGKPGADVIFNGADDDASGCAVLLEIAGALAAGPPPERTLVFLFATGEEIGLLGTEEYLDHPAVPLDRTILNVNFEMLGRPDPKVGGAGKLWLTGFELSTLGPALASASLPIVADPRPEQHFFERSDNIAFVRRGIVGQTLSSYDLHADYHTPADEADKLDYAHLELAAKASLEAARVSASGAFVPRWLAGKEPGKR